MVLGLTIKHPSLTQCEHDVMLLVAHGLDTKKIAMYRNVSPNTIQSQVKSALVKLEATNRPHAVFIMYRDREGWY